MKRLAGLVFAVCVLLVSLQSYCQETSENSLSGIDESSIQIQSQEETTNDIEPAAPDSSLGALSFWSLLRMILVLGLVVGAIYLIFHFLKKAGGTKREDSNLIKILGTKQISANKYLYLIEVGGLLYLIGSSENGVNLVSEITQQEIADELLLQAAANPEVPKKSFSEMLSGIFKGGSSGNLAGNIGSGTSVFGSSDFLKKQRERLKKMNNTSGT